MSTSSSPLVAEKTIRRRPSALKLGRLAPYPVSTANPSSPKTPPPQTPPVQAGGLAYSDFLLGGGGGQWPTRRPLLRRKSSLCSVSSGWSDDSTSFEEEEFTQSDTEVLRETIENYMALSGVTDARPPTNLAALAAKSAAPQIGKGVRATRKKIIALLKNVDSTSTPRATDPDATPKAGKKAPGMVRQGSMDFLPAQRNVALVARLGSKLQGSSAQPSLFPASGPPPSRGRLVRTHSLSSIAGSPSQPSVSPNRKVSTPTAAIPSFAMTLDFGAPSSGSLKRPLGGLGEGLASAFPSPTAETFAEKKSSSGGRNKRRNTGATTPGQEISELKNDYFGSYSMNNSAYSSSPMVKAPTILGSSYDSDYTFGSYASSSGSSAPTLLSLHHSHSNDESASSDAGTYTTSVYSSSTTSLASLSSLGGAQSLRGKRSSSSLAALADQMALDSDLEVEEKDA